MRWVIVHQSYCASHRLAANVFAAAVVVVEGCIDAAVADDAVVAAEVVIDDALRASSSLEHARTDPLYAVDSHGA
jgi:hypothetical protein